MNEKDDNYLAGFDYAKDIGYAQYHDRKPVCWRGIESFEQPFAGGVPHNCDCEGNIVKLGGSR